MKIKFTTVKLTTMMSEVIGAVLIVLFSINVYSASEDMSQATTHKLEMLKTAFELQQSSEDLTKFAGNYVVSCNIKYKELFISVSNIRNGSSPRPELLNSSYWYLPTEIKNENHKLQEPKSLDAIINELPFTEQELTLIQTSHFESSQLELMEKQMFILVEENKKKEALDMYYSEEYHKSKVIIMTSLDKLYKNLNDRFASEIKQLKQEQLNSLIRLFGIIFLLSVIKAIMPTTFNFKP